MAPSPPSSQTEAVGPNVLNVIVDVNGHGDLVERQCEIPAPMAFTVALGEGTTVLRMIYGTASV